MATEVLGQAGHFQAGAGTNHFLGRCLECDAHYLARRTLDEVERMYHQGQIGQVEWGGFSWLWAVTTDKIGCFDGWKSEPWPDARTFGELVASAHHALTGRSLDLPSVKAVA